MTSDLSAAPTPLPPQAVPRVSVVVPNYNHARFLARRLDSVLAQSFQDFELLILDDASTDDSRQVIARYLGDARVRFHPRTVNSGSPFAQWNRGVALARGEFVWLAESDDFADPRLLEVLVARLRDDSKVGLAYCQSWMVDSCDRVQGTLESYTADLEPGRWRQPFVNSGADECRRFLSVRNTIANASAVVFRRAIYHQAGGAPGDMRLAGDWLTWARMLAISDVSFTPELLNYYRSHAMTVRASTAQRRFADEEWVLRRFLVTRGLADPPTRARWANAAMEDFWNRWNEVGGNAAREFRRLSPFWWRAPKPALTAAYRRSRHWLSGRRDVRGGLVV